MHHFCLNQENVPGWYKYPCITEILNNKIHNISHVDVGTINNLVFSYCLVVIKFGRFVSIYTANLAIIYQTYKTKHVASQLPQ